MKPLVLLCLILTGCAGTTVRDRGGIARFHTQANVQYVELMTSDGDKLVMKDVNHSTPTRAGGDSITKTGATVTSAAAALLLH